VKPRRKPKREPNKKGGREEINNNGELLRIV
jgi:hypothetical protein